LQEEVSKSLLLAAIELVYLYSYFQARQLQRLLRDMLICWCNKTVLCCSAFDDGI